MTSQLWEWRFGSPAYYWAYARFHATSVLLLFIGVDGVLVKGLVFYVPMWSFFLPSSEAIQTAALGALAIGLPLLNWSSYLTAKHVFGKPVHERKLLQHGPYRYVRHPLYLAFLLVTIGFLLLALNYLLLLLTWLPLLVFRQYAREEAEMLQRYGEDYRRYRLKTGAFLPRLSRRSRITDEI